MKEIIYEQHRHKDPKFPIIFHCDALGTYHEKFVMHYHEGIEMLYFVKGTGVARCGKYESEVSVGDMIVVNSNELHFITSTCEQLKYYCLIIDKEFCEKSGISIEKMRLLNYVRDEGIQRYMQQIAKEMQQQETYYKPMVKSLTIMLLANLYREYSMQQVEDKDLTWTHKMDIVKQVIEYIKSNFTRVITVDDICQAVGFSKFYLCRTFKEVTGQTMIEYINFLRCDYARNLLATGKYNVKESAEISGFQNLSYFSKTYKKYMGKLPSRENE